jgi:hypothetical protein
MGSVVPFKPRRSAKTVSPVRTRPGVAAFYAGTDGDFQFVNRDWSLLARLGQQEAQGEGWLAAVDPADRQHIETEWQKAIEQENFLSVEFNLAGFAAPRVLLQALPQYDKENLYAGHCGTLTALPQQAKAKPPVIPFAKTESGEESGQVARLRQAIDLAGLYYFEHDLMTGTTYRSKPLRHLFGGQRTLAELRAALSPEDAPGFWKNHNQSRMDKRPHTNECRLKFPGGEAMHVKSVGVFSYDRAGQATALLGITLPIAKWTGDWDVTATETLQNLQPLIV